MGKKRLVKLKTFSIPEDDTWVINEIHRIAKLEGTAISKVIVSALKEYVRRHEEGNPQTMLVPPDRIRPFVNPVIEHRRDLLADLLSDIRSHPGQTVDELRSEWGRIHGIQEETVAKYLKQLRRKIVIRGSKVYPR